MKREEPTKGENCLPVEKSQSLQDAVENYKEVKNPVAKGETKLHESYSNRRTVLPAKDAAENKKEVKNPVAEGETKLHKSYSNRRTVLPAKDAVENKK